MDEIKKIFLESSPLATHILRFPDIKKEYPFNVNDFLKEETIGSGSFGIVEGYKHRLSNYHIAVKFINIPSKVQYNDTKKLFNEIKIHCLLPHAPNIVDFYGIGIHENKLWICMERMDMSLKMVYSSIHERLECFHENLLHYIMISVINGLEHCKENRIIHRDLKPDNVLVNWSGEVKLCDFGLSKNYENSNIGVSSNVGTIIYWPPERCQLNDSSMFENYDARSDIWSLGLMSLELICGVMPYKIYLDKSNIRFNNPIELINIISNIDVVLLIDKCFLTLEEHHQHYSPLTKEFIRSCLKEYETRPNYDVLKTMLYQQFFEDPKYLCNKIAEELKCVRFKV